MAKILVCEDERDIAAALAIYLRADGHEVITAENGAQAIELMRKQDVQLVLMDIMMPVMDGITAMLQIRTFCNVPIILLTAKGEDSDKVLGLNIGADDYVTKPFNPVELTARVRSQLRRYTQLGGTQTVNVLAVGPVTLDDRSKTVQCDGERINLTPTEYEILKLLMQHAGEVMSPKEIYRRVWKDAPYGAESTVAVHIRHIREKIEINPASPRWIKVVWAQGYKMERE